MAPVVLLNSIILHNSWCWETACAEPGLTEPGLEVTGLNMKQQPHQQQVLGGGGLCVMEAEAGASVGSVLPFLPKRDVERRVPLQRPFAGGYSQPSGGLCSLHLGSEQRPPGAQGLVLAKQGPNCSFSSCPFNILLLLEYSPWEEAFPMGGSIPHGKKQMCCTHGLSRTSPPPPFRASCPK